MIIKLKNGNTIKVSIDIEEKNNQNYLMSQGAIEGVDAKYILPPRSIRLILLSMGYDESYLKEMAPDEEL